LVRRKILGFTEFGGRLGALVVAFRVFFFFFFFFTTISKIMQKKFTIPQ
jgi:hypothetical protein